MHMNLNLHSLLLIFALVFAVLATVGVPDMPRWRWFPASLLFLIIAFIFI